MECCPDALTIGVRPKRAVLVFGSTAAGLMAAGELLSKNLEVILVDRTLSWRIANPEDVTFAALCNQIRSNPNATLLFDTDLTALSGWPGDYEVTLNTPHGEKRVTAGGILLCLTGNSQWAAELNARMGRFMDSVRERLPVSGNHPTGIWFAAASGARHGLKIESNSVHQAVSALSELLDTPLIELPRTMVNAP